MATILTRPISNPALKAALDRIYRRDPVKYKKLILWVWHSQKIGWTDEAITLTCEMADPYLDHCPNWYAYLTKLLPKATGRDNERKAAEFKRQEAGFIAGEFMEFLKARQVK